MSNCYRENLKAQYTSTHKHFKIDVLHGRFSMVVSLNWQVKGCEFQNSLQQTTCLFASLRVFSSSENFKVAFCKLPQPLWGPLALYIVPIPFG